MNPIASHNDDIAIHDRIVRHDGIDFHLLEAGDGPVLLLLHGGGSRADYFRDFILSLSDRFRVIAFDQRVFGRTEVAATMPVDHAHWASDVLGVMTALGIAKVSLLGWSMGASVAINAAWMRPERIERLFLLGGPDPANGVNVARLRERQAEVAGLDAAEAKARDAVEIAAHVGAAARLRLELIERLVEDRAATPPTRAARAIGGYATRPDLTERLPAIACPVTIIGGREDPISTPDVTTRLAAFLPHSRVVMLEGCGHYHVAEQPDAIARIISAEMGAKQA